LPGIRLRASTQARAKASGRVSPTATALTFSDSATICHSGAEAVAAEDGPRLGRQEEAAERLALGIVGPCQSRQWIGYGRKAAGGKLAHHADPRFGQGIGCIDHAERRLAARHQRQGRAHILGPGEPSCHLRPGAQPHQRRFRIAPGRHAVGIGHGQPARSQRRSQRHARAHGEAQPARRGGDQHQAVGEEICPRLEADQPPLGEVVHPLLVGRNEQVRRGPGFHLPGEGGTGGEGENRARMAMTGPGIGRGAERFLQAGRRQHHRRARRLRCHHSAPENKREDEAEQGEEFAGSFHYIRSDIA
jgi:hypothetical protein